MKYTEYTFNIKSLREDAADVLAAMLGECGFETFVPDGEAMKGYVQDINVDEEDVQTAVQTVATMMGVEIEYTSQPAPNENFNATWEAEGFQPIVIGDRVVVHATTHTDVPVCQYDIKINPCMAFGTGTHATTQMLLTWLLDHDITGASVVDAGCGTGILGILALMCGADRLFAYDIDEWSADNARGNMELNAVSGEVVLGDSRVLVGREHTATLLLANINRNILIADMARFAATLQPGGTLLISGFYADDVPALETCAAKYGLQKKAQHSVDAGWTMVEFA